MQATANQQSLAKHLGVEIDSDASLEELVSRIEQILGDSRLRELCRWFVVSAYRYQQREQWAHPDECGLSEEQQYALADSYLETADARNSLQAVLRDPRYRFTLVRFAKHRDVESLTLASGTKAFRRALQLLSQFSAGQLAAAGENIAPDREEKEEALVVDRRARRRGFAGIDIADSAAVQPLDSIQVSAQASGNADSLMNEAEYQALENELENAAPAEHRNFSYHSYEDKISLVLGMASGLVLFLLALWVF